MRKAKIVCTLGPASESPEVLEGMIRAGMNVARLNFSHGSPDEHSRRVNRVRAMARRAGQPVAILQDIQGPKIRLGTFTGGQCAVKTGQSVTVTTRKVAGRSDLLPTPSKELPQ